MKSLAFYNAATTNRSSDVLDDDLAAWLQAQARGQAEPGPGSRASGSRLVDVIGRRLRFWRTVVRVARRPA